MKETLNEKKLFTAPTVEHIEFEESDVIETSGNDHQNFIDRNGHRHIWDEGRGIWHIS